MCSSHSASSAFGPVVLFLSDVHFGRGAAAAERDKEAALLDCLEAHADRVEHLDLVGDVFDGFIEYRHLVPKGFVRFQALLARWTDRGTPVTYLLGNHDPWHRDYFAEELGVRLVPEALYAWLRPLLRHPATVSLYRSVLPADLGLGLAQWVSRALHDEHPDPTVVNALRAHARQVLRHQDAGVVVMGHSHEAALHTWPEGLYVNLGNWYENRTFARLDEDGLRLSRWNGTRVHDIEAAEV